MKTSTTTSSANTKTVKKNTKPRAVKKPTTKKVVGPTKVATKQNTKPSITTPYQLQKRVMLFAVATRSFTEKLPRQLAQSDDARNLVKATGELGTHAIEADEAPSKKSFLTNMRICRKHVKEVLYWLQLLDQNLEGYAERRREGLYNEAHDLRRIFSAICKTAAKNQA